jgi:hypothetical protein
MSPKVKKQAQDNPFYLTFGEIEGYLMLAYGYKQA